jgi:hypothetical protein
MIHVHKELGCHSFKSLFPTATPNDVLSFDPCCPQKQGCGAGARAGMPVPVPADILGFPKRHMRRPNVPAKYVGPGT